MPEEDPEQLADALEREADRLERHSEEVGEQIEAAQQDWDRKRRDESVPGAPPPENEHDPPTEAGEGPPPEARREG